MEIEVSLDINAKPAVTVKPEIHNVDQGNQTIKWKPAAQQDFAFYSLVIPEQPPVPPATSPFGAPSITASEITVTDDNSGQANGMTYEYVIYVTCNSNGERYHSKIDGSGGNTGNPTIKNN